MEDLLGKQGAAKHRLEVIQTAREDRETIASRQRQAEAALREARQKTSPEKLTSIAARLSALDAKAVAEKALAAAEAGVLSSGEQYRQHCEMTPPHTAEEIEAAEKELNTLSETYLRNKLEHEVFSAAVENGATGNYCPLCKHDLASEAITTEHVAKLYDATCAALVVKQQAARQLTEKRKKVTDFQATRVQLGEQQVATNQAFLTALKNLPDTPDGDSEALKLEQAALQAAAGRVEELEKQHTQCSTLLKTQEKRLAELSEAHERYLVEYSEQEEKRLKNRSEELRREIEPFTLAISAIEPLDRELQQMQGELTGAQRRHAEKSEQAKSLRTDFSRQLNNLSNAGKTLPEILEDIQTRQQAYLALSGEVKQARLNANTIRDRQNELDLRVAKDAGKRQLIDELRALKDTFSRGGLPLTYIRYHFNKLAALTRDNLAKMESNFTVEPDPEQPVSFIFTRLDDAQPYRMTQGKLSGGQKVRLTIALLMAVQQHILPEVGFLVLDEPSQGLDDESVEALKELLIDMGSSLGNSESQIFVCDHKPQLEPAFGAVIRTSAKAA
jgi:DNA repair exonuclease SbcCD ATPase subunit